MARLGHKINNERIAIAENEWNGLEELYIAVSENYLALLRFLDRRDPACAKRVIESHQNIIGAYNFLQGNMYCRIQSGAVLTEALTRMEDEKGWKESLSEGQQAILELGNWFYKIGEHIVSIAKVFNEK
jgi:Na+/phosphate symporter